MTQNLPLKLVSLFIAFAIWVYINVGDRQTDKQITLPLTHTGLAGNLAVTTGLPDQVELYMKGPVSRIRKIEEANSAGELKAVLDLKRADKGKKLYPIRITGANLRWMYHVLHPGPKIEVEIENFAQSTFMPERVIIGELDPDSSIEYESGMPEVVTVKGAESLVNSVTKVIYRITEADLVGYSAITVEFIPQDSLGHKVINVEVDPPSVELEITVRKSKASRQVPVVHNLAGHPPAGYTVVGFNITPLFVTVNGPSELLRDITKVETEPIDLSGHTRDFVIAGLKLIKPDKKIQLSQDSVKLEVKITQKTAQRFFENIRIQPDGGDDTHLFYYLEPSAVNITVSGPIKEVENLDAAMITPSINVQGLAEGLHSEIPITVKISVPGISLFELEPETTKVRIEKRPSSEPEGENG